MDELRHRIERQIAQASDPIKAAEYRAQRVFAQARHGEFKLAEREIVELRSRFGDGNHPRVSILILIAEGLILYFRDLSRKSIERIHLASALSEALQIKDLAATANSWLAHLYYNFDLYEKLSKSITDTLVLAENSAHDWIPRISIVIADTLQLSGKWDEADRWYHVAHRYSIQQGDRLTLGAIIFNRLAAGLSKVRADYAAKCIDKTDLRRWTTEAGSAEHFHLGLSMHALPDLLTLCNARAAFLEDHYELAVEQYTLILSAENSKLCGLNSSLISSEIVLCKLLRGRYQPSETELKGLSLNACDDLPADDRMVYHANLLEIQRRVKPQQVSAPLQFAYSTSRDAYLSSKHQLLAQIEGIGPALENFMSILDHR